MLLLCESGCFAMQNLRFYRAKPTLLERKTIGFVMCWLRDGYAMVAFCRDINILNTF